MKKIDQITIRVFHFSAFVILLTVLGCKNIDHHHNEDTSLRPTFFHNVYFYLKTDLTETEKNEFYDGLEKMASIESLLDYHIVVPAMTPREVVDNTYDVAILTSFANSEGHDQYQTDSIHDAFRDRCTPMIDKIIIYDSVLQ
ncbi:MAG TPA: Dabb family protein [Saprospiraceae bacterium]|nr:Dabb family protein [Saprospiraceae bacterium]